MTIKQYIQNRIFPALAKIEIEKLKEELETERENNRTLQVYIRGLEKGIKGNIKIINNIGGDKP